MNRSNTLLAAGLSSLLSGAGCNLPESQAPQTQTLETCDQRNYLDGFDNPVNRPVTIQYDVHGNINNLLSRPDCRTEEILKLKQSDDNRCAPETEMEIREVCPEKYRSIQVRCLQPSFSVSAHGILYVDGCQTLMTTIMHEENTNVDLSEVILGRNNQPLPLNISFYFSPLKYSKEKPVPNGISINYNTVPSQKSSPFCNEWQLWHVGSLNGTPEYQPNTLDITTFRKCKVGLNIQREITRSACTNPVYDLPGKGKVKLKSCETLASGKFAW